MSPELSGPARILDAMPGAEMLATIPEWVVPPHDEVMDLLRACGGPSPRAGYALGRERAAYWVTDVIWSTPISGRASGRPVTWTEAQVECRLASLAAVTSASATARMRQHVEETTYSGAGSEREFAGGAHDILAWLLGDSPEMDRPSV